MINTILYIRNLRHATIKPLYSLELVPAPIILNHCNMEDQISNSTVLTLDQSHSFWRRRRACNQQQPVDLESIIQTATTTTNTLRRPHRRHRKHSIRVINTLLPISLLLTTIIIYLTTLTLLVQTYNLDYQKALIKHGPKGSYFGYSIAQHATFDQQNVNSTFKSYVIVGAPKADSSRSPSLAGVVRPGGVYRCDFSLSQTCQLLDIDSMAHTNQISSYSLTTNNDQSGSNQDQPQPGQLLASAQDPVVQRDNQWLGVSVKSQGPKRVCSGLCSSICSQRLQLQVGPRNLLLVK